jgi:hypothetical protein
MAVSQPAGSLNYVDVPIKSTTSDGYFYDPSNDTVQMAFIDITSGPPGPDPQPTDFNTARWSGTPGMKGRAMASCLVGPGGAWTAGIAGHVYQIYVKVTDSPEIPILKSDTLTLT